MTKEAALYRFFNSFGIPAYPSTAVPEDAVFPWITYEAVVDDWRGGNVGLTVNVWYYTRDENEPNEKVREIAEAIGDAEGILECDGGFIWLKKGRPWCQSLQSEDVNIKRRYINITAEYLTREG